MTIKKPPHLLDQPCRDGNLSEVILVLGNPENNPTYQEDLEVLLTDGFRLTCYNGHVDIVKYILTSPDLLKNADIHQNEEYAIKLSAMYGHLSLVQFLLTSPDLKDHSAILADSNVAFIWTCETGCLDVIQYLLDSPELKEHSDINMPSQFNTLGFMTAFSNNQMEVVEYLFKHPNFDREKNLYLINSDNNSCFQLACENADKDSYGVEFLIWTCNIKLTQHNLDYINNNQDKPMVKYAEKLINTRDLFVKIHDNTTPNDLPIKSKMKI
jgi:ankyrin repeat protein